MDEINSYLCGYLTIIGLTEEYQTLTTFFEGEIISDKYPFLTRKWEADEEVDKKHWVRISVKVVLNKIANRRMQKNVFIQNCNEFDVNLLQNITDLLQKRIDLVTILH